MTVLIRTVFGQSHFLEVTMCFHALLLQLLQKNKCEFS